MKRILPFLLAIVFTCGIAATAAFAQPTQTEAEHAAAKLAAAEDAPALTDVSNGAYAPYDTVRRMYTRPIELIPMQSSEGADFRTTAIDLQNPIYVGADIAVRYTGAQPYLAFSDKKWKGWTNLYPKAGATFEANDGTGQKVTFFSRADIEARWAAYGGNPDYPSVGTGSFDCDWMFVCVRADSPESCQFLEVVALGGEERVNPLESDAYHELHGMTAPEIAKDMRAGYNMAGHFEANYVPETPPRDGGWGKSDLMLEAQWSRGVYISRETIHNLKQEGFNAIRVPVTWFQHIYKYTEADGTVNPYHIDRAWIERVHEVVDWCIAEDLYVIVNIHHEDWIDRPDLATAYDETDLPQRFRAVWTQIANEFAGYDQHLIFEDMNEPHALIRDEETGEMISWGYASAGSVSTINRLNADYVKLIREELEGHEDRLIMLAHDTGDGEISYTGFEMPDDPANLLAHSIHCYAPHAWTHYLQKKPMSVTGEDNIYTDTYRADVEAAWDNIRSRYTARGETVILGEFGCYYCGEERQAGRLEWMAQFATHSKELGVPMLYWRMDRAAQDSDGNEYTVWSAFDEKQQCISEQSKDMLAEWFAILDDDEIEWGSSSVVDEGEHDSMESADPLVDSSKFPMTIRKPLEGESSNLWRVVFEATWEDIDGMEVAVKYTGDTPRLGIVRAKADENGKTWTGQWWGRAPSSIDYNKGIAYYSFEDIKTYIVAGGYDVAYFDRIIIRTPDSGSNTPEDDKLSTEILDVRIIPHHKWGSWTRETDPTCEASGLMVRICEHDATHRLTREIAPLGHDWGEWQRVSDPTCTQAGLDQRACSRCEVTESRDVEALGHDWEDAYTVDVPATTTTEGSESRHCARCQAVTDVRAIPMLENDGSGQGGESGQGASSGSGASSSASSGGAAQGEQSASSGANDDGSASAGTAETPDTPSSEASSGGSAASGASGDSGAASPPSAVSVPQTITAKNFKLAFKGKKLVKNGKLAKKRVIKTKKLAKVKAQTKVTYKKVNKAGGKKIRVNPKSGKITLKKGLKHGVYKVKIRLKATTTADYQQAVKTIRVKIRVK